ncbi:hypothetical protein F183_A09960 [Bryobacterales bacterium F-183]|nr:hypothetical protein F183_A09960 [Bryobacterales bacterium F-183]
MNMKLRSAAPLVCGLAFLVGSDALLQAQTTSRSFSSGRLVSREVRVSSSCTTNAADLPPVVTLGPGLTLRPPKLPPCNFNFPSGASRSVTLRYDNFQITSPETTPAGTLAVNAATSTATVNFASPLTVGVGTAASWNINPPEGESVGTHQGNYAISVEGFETDQGSSCTGQSSSQAPAGSLGLEGTCPIGRTGATWSASSQTATFTVVSTVGFRYGNSNGDYVVTVRSRYQVSRLDVDRIEVLQTNQTSDNQVPLVAGKPTVVRVFPAGSAGATGAAQVRLSVFRNDELIYTQTSGTVPVAGGDAPAREDFSRTANFVLPTQAISGGEVRLEAAIQPAGSAAAGFAAAPSTSLTANFRNAPNWPQPYPLFHARICELNGQGTLDCGTSSAAATAGFKLFEQVAPLPQTGPIYTATYPAGDTRANFLRLFRLRHLVEAQLPPSAWPAQYVAVDANANRDPQVILDPVFAVGNRKLSYVSGPNALRTLIPCAISSNIGAAGTNPALIIGAPGLRPTLDGLFDVNTANLVRCNTATAAESWVSPEAAGALFRAYTNAAALPEPGAEAVEYVVVSGILRTDGTVVIDPIYRTWTANPNPPSSASSNFCFKFNTGTGPAGADYCIAEPQPVAELEGDAPFAVRLLLPPNTARITLARANGTQELAAIVRSANAPTLRLNTPAATTERNLRVSWSAGDADNDRLTYQIWASPDEGTTWVPVAVDLSAPEYTIDTALFPTATTLQVQVRASDGVNDAVQISPSIALNAAPAAGPLGTVRAGDLRTGEGRVANITLENIGAGTLRVTGVESTVAAVRYAGASLPVSIAAGQAADIPVLISGAEAGAISTTVVLRTNDPAKPSISVPVEATVYAQTGAVASLAARSLDFGAVAIGAGAERPLQIVNRGTQPLSITNIAVSNTAGIRLTSATSVSGIAPGASTEIVVRCSPSSGLYVAGSLTFNTNDPTQPAVTVPLACEGTSPVLEVPGSIVEFGTVASGQTRSQQITIRNVSSATVTVTGAVFTNSQFRLLNPRPPFTVPVGSTSTLDVIFAPTLGGIATSTLTLTTDQPNVAPQISLRGTGTGSTQTNGRLTVDPGQLAFGEVILNQSKTLILNLRNTGSGLLTITSLSPNNPVFQVQGVSLPLTIPVGSTIEAQVVFSPPAATAHNSILTISSDSTSGSDILVQLSGVGLPIPATNVSNFNGMLRQDWTARGTFVSYGPDEAIFRVVRFDNTGLQLSDTGLTIPPGSQLLPSLDSGSGWTQVRVSKGTVDGYIQFLGQQNQTFDIVPLRNTLATRYVVTGLERGSDILINNLVSDANNLVLELRANDGSIIGGNAQNIRLASRASLVQKVEQLFSATPQGFQGYLTITASQPIQATRTNHGLNSMEASPGQPMPQVATRQTNIHMPYLRAGNGWNARLQIVNPTDREARVAIRAASSTGQSVGGSPVEVTIPAGQAYWREYTQIFELDGNITWNATLSVESNISGIVAEVSYGSSFARGAFAMTDLASRRQTIPSNTAATTFYIVNPNSTPASVDLRNLQEDGNYGAGRRVSIPPRGYFGAISGLTQAPALRLESDLPVIAFATVTGDNISDFGILPGYSLDGGSTVTPGTSPRLQVDPVSLNFGTVVINESRTQTLSIRNGGTAPLTVTSITSDSPRFTVEATFPLTVVPGGTQQVIVRYTPAGSGGTTQTGTLTVTSNDSVTGPVTIGLTGQGSLVELPKVRIDATPAALEFGDVNSGQTKDLSLTIRNSGTDPLVVTGITISNPRFQLVFASFPLTVAPAGLTSLQVRFLPTAPGVQTGTLLIASNDSDNRTASIALRGNGVGSASSPKIVVSAANFEFGTVQVGESGERTFSITNTGTAPLIIQSLNIDNPNYTVGPAAPFTLAPGAIADMAVLFVPKVPQSAPASLRIISNDPVNGTIILPITGVSVQ